MSEKIIEIGAIFEAKCFLGKKSQPFEGLVQSFFWAWTFKYLWRKYINGGIQETYSEDVTIEKTIEIGYFCNEKL